MRNRSLLGLLLAVLFPSATFAQHVDSLDVLVSAIAYATSPTEDIAIFLDSGGTLEAHRELGDRLALAVGVESLELRRTMRCAQGSHLLRDCDMPEDLMAITVHDFEIRPDSSTVTLILTQQCRSYVAARLIEMALLKEAGVWHVERVLRIGAS